MMKTAGETIDDLRGHDLRIIQQRKGYRFSVDPLLLADFVPLKGNERIVDLGAGCGIIPLLLARRAPNVRITGVERQEALATMATRNAALNGVCHRVEILPADIQEIRAFFPVSSFDVVIANPPYRRPGTGRISPTKGRDLARHESTAGMPDFLAVAKYLVKPGGRVCFVHLPSRLAEFFTAAAAVNLAPLRLRMVHDAASSPARMFLIELAKGRKGDLMVMPPYLIRTAHGEYTEEMAALLENRGEDGLQLPNYR